MTSAGPKACGGMAETKGATNRVSAKQAAVTIAVKPGLWVLAGLSLLFFIFYPYS